MPVYGKAQEMSPEELRGFMATQKPTAIEMSPQELDEYLLRGQDRPSTITSPEIRVSPREPFPFLQPQKVAFQAPRPEEKIPRPAYPEPILPASWSALAEMPAHTAGLYASMRLARERKMVREMSGFDRGIYIAGRTLLGTFNIAGQAEIGLVGAIPGVGEIVRRAERKGIIKIPSNIYEEYGKTFGNTAGMIGTFTILGPVVGTSAILTDVAVFTPGSFEEKAAAVLETAAMLAIFYGAGKAGHAALKKYGTTAVRKAILRTAEAGITGANMYGLTRVFGVEHDEALMAAIAWSILPQLIRAGIARKYKKMITAEFVEEVYAESAKLVKGRLEAEKPKKIIYPVRETPIEKPAVKQSWEMTRKEYDTQMLAESREWQRTHGPEDRMMPMRPSHRSQVRKAIAEGKSVPPEVLAEYPELGKPAVPEKPTERVPEIPREPEVKPLPTEVSALREDARGILGLSELDYSKAGTLRGKVRKQAEATEMPFLFEKGEDRIRIIPEHAWRKQKGEYVLKPTPGKMAITIQSGERVEYKTRLLSKWGEETANLRRSGFTNVTHKTAVEEALRKKTPVPLEVMAEYYDLVQKYATEPQKQQLADRAEKVHEEAHRAEIEATRIKLPKIRRALTHQIIDVSGNLKAILRKHKEVGQEVIIRHDLQKGSHPYATLETDRAAKEISRGLTARDDPTFSKLVTSTRLAEIQSRDFQYKEYANLEEAHHREWIERLPTEVKERLFPAREKFFGEMDKALDDYLQAGIISTEEHARMRAAGPYSPINYIHRMDPVTTYRWGRATRTVGVSGLHPLDEGSMNLIRRNWRYALAQVKLRTAGRIANNFANQAMYEFAEQVRDNGFVRLAEMFTTPAGKTQFAKTPTNSTAIDVMFGGKKHRLWMIDEMAREWIGRDPGINETTAAIARWASGSSLLKAGATGYNPLFTLTNFPRDIEYIFITTGEYFPEMAIAHVQIAADLLATKGDAIRRRGLYEIYAKHGGLMQFLTQQGAITKAYKTSYTPLGKLFRGTLDVLSWAGETSEIWPRLALMRRSKINQLRRFRKEMKREPNAEEMERIWRKAVWVARTYLDFAQGGQAIKVADTVFPYINASVQATRGLAKALRDRPVATSWKLLEFMGLVTGLEIYNIVNNPEAYKDISSHDQANFLNITTPLTKKDREGNPVWFFGRIAISPEARIPLTLGKSLARSIMGLKVNTKHIADAARSSFSIVPEQFWPPTAKALFGYMFNMNFWTGRGIHPRGREHLPAREHFRAGITHPALIKSSQILGFKADEAGYALAQVFPRGNPVWSGISFGLETLLEGLPDVEKKDLMLEILDNPWAARIFKTTRPYGEIEKIREDRIEEDTRRIQLKRPVENLLQEYKKKPSMEIAKEMYEYVVEITDKRDQKLVGDYIEREIKRLGISSPVYSTYEWAALKESPVEARAKTFREKAAEIPPEQRLEFGAYAILFDVLTPDVMEEIIKQLEPSQAREIPVEELSEYR